MMSSGSRRWVLGALIIAAALATIGLHDRVDPAAVEAAIRGTGALAPLLFLMLYTAGAVVLLPGWVLTLAGGALFGPVLGTALNLAGATLGAALAFVIARYMASDWVARRAGGRLRQLKEGVEAEGWRFVAFLRLVPLFPYNLTNYALGVTRIPLLAYVLTTLLCMAPATAAYTYLGYVGREAATGASGLIQKALLALGLLAGVTFLSRVIPRLRRRPGWTVRELARRREAGEAVEVLDIRPRDAFMGQPGHVPGARNIPLDDLPHRLHELADATERPIALVCDTERRCARATDLLVRHGFADVHEVQGGMPAWRDAGLPVEAGIKPSDTHP